MIDGKPNTSGPPRSVVLLSTETSDTVFDEKALETLSLRDFVDLLHVTGLMKLPGGQLLGTDGIEGAIEYIGRIKKSRFSFLVDQFYAGERLIYYLRIQEDPKDPIARLHASGIMGLVYSALPMVIGFLDQLLSLPRHQVHLASASKKRDGTERDGSRITFVAEPGHASTFRSIRSDSVTWIVSPDGKLVAQQFRQVDPSEGLLKRLFTLLDGADPARIRKCSFEDCDKIFYAKRLDQLCCSKACNNNRLQRQWYKDHGKAAVYARAGRKADKGHS